MKKRIIAAFLAALMLFSFVGCGASTAGAGAESTTHTITDLLGREVKVPNEINKIAAIAG